MIAGRAWRALSMRFLVVNLTQRMAVIVFGCDVVSMILILEGTVYQHGGTPNVRGRRRSPYPNAHADRPVLHRDVSHARGGPVY